MTHYPENNNLEHRLQRLESKIDDIHDDITEVKELLAASGERFNSHDLRLDSQSKDIDKLYNRSWVAVLGLLAGSLSLIITLALKLFT